MKYNMNDLQFGDPGFKFTRVKHGYNPEEVDTVIETQKQKIDALIQQSKDLTNESNRLNQALSQCNIKIQQLAQSTNLMEQERQKEKLRLADVMTSAGRTAEEIVNDARRKAEEIIADANLETRQLIQQAVLNAKIVHKELASLTEVMRTARESSNRHYDRLDSVIQSAADFIDSRPESIKF